MALLEGLSVDKLDRTDRELKITDGAEKLISNLRLLGYKTAILSGGFEFFATRLARRLGIDYVHANQLDVADGKLTGNICGEIVDDQRKAELLRSIAESEGIQVQQVIVVGDAANDITMLSSAGLGIAFHSKPEVCDEGGDSLGTVGRDGILYLIGMRDNEIRD